MMRTVLVVITCVGALGCGARGSRVAHPSAAPASPSATRDAAAPTTGSAADAAPPAESAEPAVIELEPVQIEVVSRGVDGKGEHELVAYDARSLLDRGNDELSAGRNDDALATYDKLLSLFPNSRLAPSAIYNAGLASEAKGDYDAAIRRYLTLANDRALHRDSIDAHMRVAAVQAELERWTQAKSTLQAVLARTDLTHSDRIEAMARLGYVSLEQDDLTGAELILGDAIDYYKKLTSSLDSNYFVAMAYYYLAQIPHQQFLAIPMRLPDEQLRKDLETKSELVARAYDRYLDVLDIQQVYWATAAGYQMSQIYKELWDDIVRAPIPTQLSPEAATIYVTEVHARVLSMLRKAMEGHTKNVELAAAYRASTVWSEASRTQVTAISQLLAREAGGEIVVPPPRDRQPLTARADGARSTEYVPGRVDL